MTTDTARVRIGTYRVAEPYDYRIPQEYAGADEIVRVDAGDHPVVIKKSRYYPKKYAGIELHGIHTHSGFLNRIGSHTSYRSSKPNKPITTTWQLAPCEIARMAAAGKIELAEDFEARPRIYLSSDWDSHFKVSVQVPEVMYRLFHCGEAVLL